MCSYDFVFDTCGNAFFFVFFFLVFFVSKVNAGKGLNCAGCSYSGGAYAYALNAYAYALETYLYS